MTDIDQRALDSLSVAPDGKAAGEDPRQEAGQDTSIADRPKADADDADARLDDALDESMDASDPPASTQPGRDQGPAESSGYDAEAEKALQEK